MNFLLSGNLTRKVFMHSHKITRDLYNTMDLKIITCKRQEPCAFSHLVENLSRENFEVRPPLHSKAFFYLPISPDAIFINREIARKFLLQSISIYKTIPQKLSRLLK
uniref:Uncharacterized protein n=1 Tax=Nelumbo nucifera TaxID=4432 RepID=A0A822ZLD2_NELNU|nr:TPA_asm: hypothetical protein HUJ06_002581 [Nelumbo nucifera]